MRKKAILIFMKYPEAGRVKTRLSKSIGREQACNIYQKLVRRTLGMVSDFKHAHTEIDLFLFYYPPESETQLRKAYPGPWKFTPQMSGHLGEKMGNAFNHVFTKGYGHAVLIGTDIADIMTSDIADAFQALNENQAVLGPAQDGGFYLIGLSSTINEIFNFPNWSTPSVFERTLNCFHASAHKVRTLCKRHDIDEKKDLIYFNSNPLFQDQISIIIPYLSGTKKLASLVDCLEAQLWPGDEVVLVRGNGSPEWGTKNISPHTRLIFAPKGRGNQLNHGARVAQRNILWFLHIDTAPPPNFGYHIRKLTLIRHMVLGCFELSFNTSSLPLNLISKWTNLRTKYFQLPYGDQGFFCTRRIFYKAGGFKKQFLMEDVDFVRNCKKMGKLLIVPQPIHSSPQRYLTKGVLRASLQNHFLILLYFLGVSDKRLYEFYYKEPI
ncbi:MAG: TIGR04283 family arsenosugar biosynthesis glycosyltransferase [Pseudomonadota bacterium]